MRVFSVAAYRATAIVLALGLLGCGSAHPSDGSLAGAASELPRAPGGTVARVGTNRIDQAAYEHLFAAEAFREEGSTNKAIPIPPRFEQCVTRLESIVRKLGLQLRPGASLRAQCRERYEALRERTLNRLLTGAWIFGAAGELGLTVDTAQVRRELDRAKQEHFPNEAQFRQFAAQTGMNESDLAREVKVELLSRLIHRAIIQRLGPFPRARVKAYYESHPNIDAIPEARDLEIVRADTVAGALRMKREIATGRSFASLARGRPEQPVGSRNALVVNYNRIGHFRQPALNKAIMAAKLHVVSDPVFLDDPTHAKPERVYVFRVIRIDPQRQRPFHDVEAQVLKTLPERLRRQAVTAFVSTWTARWQARTSCASGYRVPLCERAHGVAAPVSLDARNVFD